MLIAMPPRRLSKAFAERLEELRRRRAGPRVPRRRAPATAETSRAASAASPSSRGTRGAPMVAVDRRALPRARAAAAAGRAHLHPRDMHDRRGRPPAGGQRRAAPEGPGGDGPAVRGLSGGDRAHGRDRRACDVLPRTSSRYEYPDEPVPPGKTPQQHLEDLTWSRRELALRRRRSRRRSRPWSARSSRSSRSSTTPATS